MIGRLERVSLREVWEHETDATRWLQDNIDVIGDVIDLRLSGPEREQRTGSFSVDLVAEDESGNPVIIENQLERSNHDHLGKLITYSVGVGAKTAVWIVADPRPEHVSAIAWLNESSSAAAFHLLKLEAVRIGDSPPAPLVTLIVGPSEESREGGGIRDDWARRHVVKHRFWTELLERAEGRTKLHAGIAPTRYSWVGTGAGRGGLGFNYAIRQHDAQVELYIDRGRDRAEENQRVFNQLVEHKDAVESVFEAPLEWQSLEGRRACRIRKVILIGGYRDEDKWPEIQDEMVNAMIRLEKALAPHVAALTI